MNSFDKGVLVQDIRDRRFGVVVKNLPEKNAVLVAKEGNGKSTCVPHHSLKKPGVSKKIFDPKKCGQGKRQCIFLIDGSGCCGPRTMSAPGIKINRRWPIESFPDCQLNQTQK